MIALAGDADRSAVRLNDRFGDRQPHPSSLNKITLILPPIEFVKDQPQFHILDARPFVGDAGKYNIPVGLRGDGNRLLLRRISIGIFD